MYKLLRVWSIAVIGLIVTYLVIGAIVGLTVPSRFLEAFGLWLGVASAAMGFMHLPVDEILECYSENVGASCDAMMATAGEQIGGAATLTILYLALVLIAAGLMLFAATRLERAQVNALVIHKLRTADATYVDEVLGIDDVDLARVGYSDDGVEYAADVLAREATGGVGDARFTQRQADQLEAAAGTFDARVRFFDRWRPLYEKYATPSALGVVQLIWRVHLIIFFIAAGWFALFSVDAWIFPLLLILASLAAVYLWRGRWRDTFVQLGGNDTYLLLTVLLGMVFCVLDFVLLLMAGMIFGSRASVLLWMPYLTVYVWAAGILVVAIPLANYVVYRAKANSAADRTIAVFFRTLLGQKVHGTHAFAVCDSCMTTTVLVLGQAHDCEACGRPVDASMKVRTIVV